MNTEKQKLGYEPAFPTNDDNYGNSGIHDIGISKRFYAACSAMQGIMSNSYALQNAVELAKKQKLDTDYVVVTMAYELADKLLEQENL